MAGAAPAGRASVDQANTSFFGAFRRFRWLGLLLVAVAVFHAVFIWRTSTTIGGHRYFVLFDDAMISMRFARNLAHGDGLLWNPGQAPVEGITNPAWTAWMALIHLLPMPDRLRSLPVMLTSSALVLATIVNVTRAAALLSPRRIAPVAAALMAATYYPFAYWALRGMEVGLLGFLIVSGLLLVIQDPGLDERRTRVWFPVIVVLLIATRMDALIPALVLIIGGVWLARPARRLVTAAWGGGTALVTTIAITIARELYYGYPLPNTYYLKATGIPLDVRLDRGWTFLRSTAVTDFGPYLLLAVAGVALAVVRRDRRMALPVAIVVAAAAYDVWAGGDAWEYYQYANRYLSTVAPVLMIVAGVGVAEWLAPSYRYLRARIAALTIGLALMLWWIGDGGPAVAKAYQPGTVGTAGATQPLKWAALVVLVVGVIAILQVRPPSRSGVTARARKARHLTTACVVGAALVVVVTIGAANQVDYRDWFDHNAQAVAFDHQMVADGLRYRRATTPDAVIAFGAAGSAAYFSDRRSIDLLGKSDVHIAHERPRSTFFTPGHDKFDFAYSLGRLHPDLVTPTLPLARVAGYRIAGPLKYFEQVRVGTKKVNLTELLRH